MDSNTEDRVGTLVKTNQFLIDNATALAANPSIAETQAVLETDTENIFQQDSTATRNLGGYTEVKTHARTALENSLLLVRAGVLGYYTANPDPRKRVIVDVTDTAVKQKRDNDLYILADQIHDVADPVKDLLTPFSITPDAVDGLLTLATDYKAVLQLPRSEEGISIAAGKHRDRLVDQCFNETLPKLDAYLLPHKYTNPDLYDAWLVARAIDNSGGGSDSSGFTVSNFVLAPGATVGFGPSPVADRNIYLRQIGGTVGVIVCTGTTLTACAAGKTLTPNETIKVPFGDLGISGGDLLNFTNPGTTTVTVRAGLKNE